MLEILSHDTNIWVLCSFVIFAFILIKAGKSAMVTVVDTKIEKIKRELEEAENLHTEAQELLAQYQRKHANAVKESEKIIENAETYANKIRKQAKKELKENIIRREQQLEERIGRMKSNALLDIKRNAANIAIAAAREVITAGYTKKLDKTIVDETIKNVRTTKSA